MELRSGHIVCFHRHGRARCRICNEMAGIYNTCCGLNVCLSCDARVYGQCYIHEREEINETVHCEACAKRGTMMTIHWCEHCDRELCSNCLLINKSPTFLCHRFNCIINFKKECDISFSLDDLVGLMGEEIMQLITNEETEADVATRTLHDSCQKKDPNGNVIVNGIYYANSGRYQHTYDTILGAHMPDRGNPTTGGKNAMMVYCLFRIQREFCHNFFMNIDWDLLTNSTVESLKRDTYDGLWNYTTMLGFLASKSEFACEILKRFILEAAEAVLDE